MEEVERYISYLCTQKRYSGRTCSIYADVLESFFNFADSVDITSVRNYEVHLMDTLKCSPRTVSLHLSVLSGFCRFMIMEGKMESNPVRLVKRPKQGKRLPEFFRDESMEEYFRSHTGTLEYGDYDSKLRYIIVSILEGTGMRRSELTGLDISSVDFSRKTIRVCGKGDKIREIPLTDTLCNEISLYLSAASSLTGEAEDMNTPLLRTAKGKRLYPVLVDRAIKRELEGVRGITGKRSPHVLRHTLATELLNAGTDLNSIKELLGHSSLAATQVYTHNSIERLQEVYANTHPRAKNGKSHGD